MPLQRIGLFSDAHGNTAAFLAAYTALIDAGAAEIWYLGDLVGYVPDPAIVTEARTRPIRCLLGNHEQMMLTRNSPGPHEADYHHDATKRCLTPDDLTFLKGLDPAATRSFENRHLLLVHGSPADPVNGYVYPDTDLSPFCDVEADVVFMGHTHRPMDRRAGTTRFVNVGSCGLPRDGSGYGSACLYNPATDDLEFLQINISDACRALTQKYNLSEAVLKHYRTAMSTTNSEVLF